MTRLHSVPGRASEHGQTDLGRPPAAAPLDQITRARLRRLLVSFFGEFATLDRHLDLVDARGAWYAEAALGAWSPEQPDGFFGLVRHVVRTQLDGPAPAPDIEGWLRAGVPAGDEELVGRWRHIRLLHPDHQREPEHPRVEITAAIAATDEVVASWPAEHWGAFVLAYVKLERVLTRRAITLPPISD